MFSSRKRSARAKKARTESGKFPFQAPLLTDEGDLPSADAPESDNSDEEFRAIEARMLSQWASVPEVKDHEEEVEEPEVEDNNNDDDDDETDDDDLIINLSRKRRKRRNKKNDDDDDDEERQSSEDELTKTIKPTIKVVHDQFMRNYQSDLRRCVAENYCCAANQIVSVELDRAQKFENLPFKEFGAGKKRESGSCSSSEKESSKIPVTVIGKSQALPVSINYVTVRRNLIQEDDKSLRFLPYFGEDDNIKLDFNAYSSDEDESDIEAVADDDTILSIVEHYGMHERTLESLSEILKFSSEMIKKRVNELTFFYERRSLEQRQILYHYDFDSDSTDMMTDSYQKLFCRRCSSFDCRYHGLFQPRPCVGRDDRRFFIDSSLQQCLKTFLEDASVEEPSLPLVVANKRKKKEERKIEFCNGVWNPPPSYQEAASLDCVCSSLILPSRRYSEFDDDWTLPQSAMFRKLFFVLGIQFCAIAQILGSKTCAQVREYACSFPFLFVHRSLSRIGLSEEDKRKKGMRTGTIKVPSTSPPQHIACDHLGPCDSECSCVSTGMFCELYCPCDSGCRNRFLGCVCKTFCRTRACPCFAASRECTPGLCEGCVVPPTEKSGTLDAESCCNMSMQTRNFKQLLLAKSTVHGWGAFIASDALKNELITEYLGEVITQEEADRRGKIYDKLNRSYLFHLNEQYVVDAARKGNKIKFANHSQTPNCFSKVMMVNGDHRIGIYAKKKIFKGDELFFDYQHEYLGQAPEWFEKNGQRKENSLKSSVSRKS